MAAATIISTMMGTTIAGMCYSAATLSTSVVAAGTIIAASNS